MTPALDIQNLSVTLDRRTVLGPVSLAIAPGDFIGLVGPNGAGKSTLLKAAAGLLPAESGAIHIAGAPLTSLSAAARARALSYLPQARPVAWPVPARAVVALGRFAYGDPLREDAADGAAIDCALAACDAAHLAARPVSALSGGELARIHLARALAGETPLLLADEPLAALDLKHQLAVMRILAARAQNGGAVVAALHDLALATKYCTRIIVLNEGAIVADGSAGETLCEKTVSDVFGVALEEAGLWTR